MDPALRNVWHEARILCEHLERESVSAEFVRLHAEALYANALAVRTHEEPRGGAMRAVGRCAARPAVR